MQASSSRFAPAFQPLPVLVGAAVLLAGVLGAAGAGGFFDDRSVIAPPAATPSTASPRASVPPEPSATPPASVPPSVVRVDLVERVGADATIDITDRSGRLVGARSGDPGDGASVPDGTVSVTGVAADPATVVLTWSGLPCDTTHQLTISPDGLDLRIQRPACQGDTLPVDRVLQLTFDGPIDPAAVNATIRTIER